LRTDTLEKICGICCYYLIPIRQNYLLGNGEQIAICTLSSLDLLYKIGKDEELINKIVIVGRLLSENKGIDLIIKFINKKEKLRHLVICGKDVNGHLSGQALLSLKKEGVDKQNRIIGAKGRYPILSSSPEEIDNFRKKIDLVNQIGLTDLKKIKSIVFNI
jgi:tetrahydromethanopterin S-methyltransferase subunit A